ncbi:MAG: hypothetical protein Q8O57_06935, partial [Kiritimatiellota bacterium]|nr:hypothetical protein [Kiritimatiellota bacterium]
MHRITCWNGFVFVAAICLGLMVTSARGGSLDAPAGPASSNSAMFTLDDIYHKLNMRTNVTKRTGGFSEPSAAPTTGTMHTLNEIMILATNRAPVPMTRQTTVYAVGDDGTYGTSLGVAWPNPRFTVVGA